MQSDLILKIMGDASGLNKSLDTADGRIKKFGDGMTKAGGVVMAAGAAVTGAFAAIVGKTAQLGDTYDKMSLRTGISVENLSALGYAADISGTSLETVEKGIKGLTQSMEDNARGVGESLETYEKLGVKTTDIEGNLRPTIDVFKDISAAIAEMDNPAEQAAASMNIFGAKAGTQLLPMLKQGEDGIAALMDKAGELGITMSTGAATDAAEFTDRMTDLTGSLGAAGRTIGEVLIPAIIPLIEKVTSIIGKVGAWATANPELIEQIVKVGAVVGGLALPAGGIMMAIGAITKIGTAMKLLAGVGSPIGLLVLAVGGLILIWKNWDEISAFVTEWAGKITGYLSNLKDVAIEKITEMVDWIIQKFKDLADLPKQMLDAGKNLVGNLADGAKEAGSKVVDSLKGIGDKFKNFLKPGSPTKEGALSEDGGTGQWGYNLISNLADGMTLGGAKLETSLKYTGEVIKDDVSQWTTVMKDFAGMLSNKLGNAFSDIISGTKSFGTSMKDLFTGIVDSVISQFARIAASTLLSFIFPQAGLFSLFGANAGGGVKGFASGGGVDTIPAMLTAGEYVVAKPMVDFIKSVGFIPQSLTGAIATGAQTPKPAFAMGGGVGINSGSFGETKINIDIHGNTIANDVDIRKLADTVSDKVLRTINKMRKH